MEEIQLSADSVWAPTSEAEVISTAPNLAHFILADIIAQSCSALPKSRLKRITAFLHCNLVPSIILYADDKKHMLQDYSFAQTCNTTFA